MPAKRKKKRSPIYSGPLFYLQELQLAHKRSKKEAAVMLKHLIASGIVTVKER